MEELALILKEKEKEGLLRSLRPISERYKSRIKVGAKSYIDFSSNDYLGLSSHPDVIAAAKAAMDKFGASSSASRLLSGDLDLHHQLEERIAQFKNKEAALIFNSGYQANVGIISTLFGKDDCIFSDRLNHASIIDGIKLSGARFLRFSHNDIENLESLLKKERKNFKNALIVSETIFSMDGDGCPLKDLVCLKNKYNCQLMVDEAHATGIFGKNGAGFVEECGLEKEVDLIMGTFSKGLGGYGAYLASSIEIRDYLINACRSFIYSTSLPPAVIAGNLAAIDLISKEPLRREALLSSAHFFRNSLRQAGFNVLGDSQIVPLIIGDNQGAVDFACKLQEKGYWVLPIRPPTVPKKDARLRFSLTHYHTKEILGGLVDEICKIKI